MSGNVVMTAGSEPLRSDGTAGSHSALNFSLERLVSASADLLGKELVIQSDVDLTPPGKRRVQKVRHSLGGRQCGAKIRWYVGRTAYRTLADSPENAELSASWLAAKTQGRGIRLPNQS